MIFSTKKPIIFLIFKPRDINMFIGYFFKGNPNLEVSRVTKAIFRAKGNNKNDDLRDQTGSNSFFFKYANDTCL